MTVNNSAEPPRLEHLQDAERRVGVLGRGRRRRSLHPGRVAKRGTKGGTQHTNRGGRRRRADRGEDRRRRRRREGVAPRERAAQQVRERGPTTGGGGATGGATGGAGT
jgi:hypothetical protein